MASDGMQITTGEEALVINGKKIATRWESLASAKDPQFFTKTWRSDEVPGGLVLQRSQNRDMTVNTRHIGEEIWAPVEGVVPERGDSSGQAPASNAAQPAGTNRDARPAGTVSRSDARAVPATPAPPAPAPVAPPPPRGRPDPSAMSPAVQAEFMRHFSAIMARTAQDRTGLALAQKGPAIAGAPLPQDIRAAMDRLTSQQRAFGLAMRTRDNAAAEQNLRAMEDTLAVIEKFLGK
jgi:hypothetical protein